MCVNLILNMISSFHSPNPLSLIVRINYYILNIIYFKVEWFWKKYGL